MTSKMFIQVRSGKLSKGKMNPEPQLCNYSGHICLLNQLDGYNFCIRHILEDANAPYRQCSFVYSKNGKRCPNAAPKIENKESYCSDHTKKILQARQRSLRKKCPQETVKTLLEDLKHHAEDETVGEKKKSETGTTISTASHKGRKLDTTPSICKILDYASNSESDSELPVVARTWKAEPDSDAESLDSDYEDPLRHAGVYTAEEAALITREKMIRLQSLYIQELKRLNHVLRERRKAYTQAIKDEKESLGSIHATPRTTSEEERQYQKLKAMLRYHTKRGPELILHKRACQLRLAQSSKDKLPKTTPSLPSCVQVSGENQCTNNALPLSSYCMDHILLDPKQVLFKPCRNDVSECPNPIFPGIDGDTCSLHSRPGVIPRPVIEEKKVNKTEPMAIDGVVNNNQTVAAIADDFIRAAEEEQIQASALALLESLQGPYDDDFLHPPPVPQEHLLAMDQNSSDEEELTSKPSTSETTKSSSTLVASVRSRDYFDAEK